MIEFALRTNASLCAGIALVVALVIRSRRLDPKTTFELMYLCYLAVLLSALSAIPGKFLEQLLAYMAFQFQRYNWH